MRFSFPWGPGSRLFSQVLLWVLQRGEHRLIPGQVHGHVARPRGPQGAGGNVCGAEAMLSASVLPSRAFPLRGANCHPDWAEGRRSGLQRAGPGNFRELREAPGLGWPSAMCWRQEHSHSLLPWQAGPSMEGKPSVSMFLLPFSGVEWQDWGGQPRARAWGSMRTTEPTELSGQASERLVVPLFSSHSALEFPVPVPEVLPLL